MSTKQRMTKADRIRQYRDEHPEASGADVARALEKYGVTATNVYNVEAQRKRRSEPPRNGNFSVTLHLCRQLIEQAGSIDNAKSALDQLKALREML